MKLVRTRASGGASLLPLLSNAILEKMAEGIHPKKLRIGIDAQHQFTTEFSD